MLLILSWLVPLIAALLAPLLGDVGQNFASINDTAKWILCVAMLLGRLEIFTLLVLFTPAFWKK